jgi:hypothetical protein
LLDYLQSNYTIVFFLRLLHNRNCEVVLNYTRLKQRTCLRASDFFFFFFGSIARSGAVVCIWQVAPHRLAGSRVWCLSGGPNRRIPHSPPRDSQPTSVKCGRVSDSFARFSQCPPSVQPTFQLALYLHQPRPPFARRRRRYGEGKVQGKAHRPPQLLNTRGDR